MACVTVASGVCRIPVALRWTRRQSLGSKRGQRVRELVVERQVELTDGPSARCVEEAYRATRGAYFGAGKLTEPPGKLFSLGRYGRRECGDASCGARAGATAGVGGSPAPVSGTWTL
jgi:hypothetical protein